MFKPPIELPGYYQEPIWTQELQRMGIENVEEELAINFNYQSVVIFYSYIVAKRLQPKVSSTALQCGVRMPPNGGCVAA